MTEEEFIFGTEEERVYVKNLKDKDEKDDISWEIRGRKRFIKYLTPEVKKIFLENFERNILPNDFSFDTNVYPDPYLYNTKKAIYYVYEDYTCDDNKVCYVGYSNDPSFTYTSERDKRIVMLRQKKGVAMRKLIDNLTEFQAEVYTLSYKKECLKRGEILLNIDMDRSRSNRNDEIEKSKGNPFIYKDLFLKRYFEDEYNKDLSFDEVTSDSLKCTCFLNNQNREVCEWLREKNAIILRTVGKTVKSIIVSPYITYYDYIKYREKNIRIISEKDVKEFIRNNPDHPQFKNKKKVLITRIRNPEKRDYIRGYLNENSCIIEEYLQYMGKNDYPIRDMQNPLSTIILQKSLPADEYYTDINRILMWEASYLQNGNADRLIDLYLQLGLYDEAIPLLEKNDNRAADYYYYRDQVKQDQ